MSKTEQRAIFWFSVLLTALIVAGTWFIVYKLPEWFKEERREIPTQPIVNPIQNNPKEDMSGGGGGKG